MRKIEQFILDSNENTVEILALLKDIKHIAANAEIYQHRLKSMIPIVISLVQIVDSRRSIAEKTNMTQLTYLALIFVPLTFVPSIFSMSGHLAPGGKSFWIYFVIAIPLVICRPGSDFLTTIVLLSDDLDCLYELCPARIRTVTLGSNFTVRIFSKSCGNLGGEVAKTLLKHLFY